jgi:hypothetical protein
MRKPTELTPVFKLLGLDGPSEEQLAAVQAFAAKYANLRGGWKEHLITCWMSGADAREPSGHLLRQVRNQFGPSWLETYGKPARPTKAPKAKASVPTAELVQAVKEHAVKFYRQNGWDFIVECWSDAEIEEAIAGCRSKRAAIAAVRKTAQLLAGQRSEIENA